MSDLAEKLARPETASGTRARAKATQLAAMWGADFSPANPPPSVRVVVMGEVHTWRYVTGKGPESIYELTLTEEA